MATKGKPKSTHIDEIAKARALNFIYENKDNGTFTHLRLADIAKLIKREIGVEPHSATLNGWLTRNNIAYAKYAAPGEGSKPSVAQLRDRVARLEAKVAMLCSRLGEEELCADIDVANTNLELDV